MFTIYHAIAFVSVFGAGMLLGHVIGKADGEEQAARDIDAYWRAKRRAERAGCGK